MTHKSILLLNTLLLTASLSTHPNMSNETRIQKLESTILKKMYALSELGEKIAEKQKLIKSIFNDMQSYMLDGVTVLKLEGEERKKFIEQAGKLCQEFFKKFQKAIINKNVQGFLVKELFNDDESYIDNLEVLKFLELRAIIEHTLIRMFVEKYEAYLQETIDLGDELEMMKDNSK